MVDQKQQEPSHQSENAQSGPPEDQGDYEFDSGIKPKQVLVTDEELRSMQKELLEYKDKYLRLLAEGENARKRLQKRAARNYTLCCRGLNHRAASPP